MRPVAEVDRRRKLSRNDFFTSLLFLDLDPPLTKDHRVGNDGSSHCANCAEGSATFADLLSRVPKPITMAMSFG